jgi:hypothetical protein
MKFRSQKPPFAMHCSHDTNPQFRDSPLALHQG